MHNCRGGVVQSINKESVKRCLTDREGEKVEKTG